MAYIANSGASASDGVGATTIAVTLGAAVAVGDLIVGMTGAGDTAQDISTVTDSLSNTYTLQGNKINDTTDGQWGRTFFSKVTTAGTPAITVTFTASLGSRVVVVAAYSGIGAAPPNDGTTGATQSAPGTATDAVTSGNITPTVNGDTIIGFFQNSGLGSPTVSAGTNYTLRLNGATIVNVEDFIQTTAAAVAGTFTLSVDTATIAHVAAFKATAAGSVVAPRSLALLGVGT